MRALCLAALALTLWTARPLAAAPKVVDLEDYLALTGRDEKASAKALAKIGKHWQGHSAPMLLELLLFVPTAPAKAAIVETLEARTAQRFGRDVDRWWRWVWETRPDPHPRYAEFKSLLYSTIDSRFARYFEGAKPATIRLDEIRWGGVRRDGIPPLDQPPMVAAAEATYLADGHVVFGFEHRGEARAYPQRILGWHELVRDRVGGEAVTGVYCTLCGTMIFYRSTVGGVEHVLGTSGFLYRSNKLMYDRDTRSLWSTFTGKPVVGSLVGRGIALEPLSVVTTTWATWRARHPKTLVLALATGHQRDYREGAAYRDYYATDDLMFPVPKLDDRLANKAEVLGLRFGAGDAAALAVSAAFLSLHPVYQDVLGGVEFVIFTDPSGANRVYERRGRVFSSWDGDRRATDEGGKECEITESQLLCADGVSLARLPSHRAFWFGWFSAFPQTRLVR